MSTTCSACSTITTVSSRRRHAISSQPIKNSSTLTTLGTRNKSARSLARPLIIFEIASMMQPFCFFFHFCSSPSTPTPLSPVTSRGHSSSHSTLFPRTLAFDFYRAHILALLLGPGPQQLAQVPAASAKQTTVMSRTTLPRQSFSRVLQNNHC